MLTLLGTGIFSTCDYPVDDTAPTVQSNMNFIELMVLTSVPLLFWRRPSNAIGLLSIILLIVA